MAKSYSEAIKHYRKLQTSKDEILNLHEQLEAKRILVLILPSHESNCKYTSVGDTVQIFIKIDKERQVSWSSPRAVTSI